MRQASPREARLQIREREIDHACARRHAGASDVRSQHDVGELQQGTRRRQRFVREDIEAGRREAPGAEQWVVTIYGVVRYSAAKLAIEARPAAVSRAVAGGVAVGRDASSTPATWRGVRDQPRTRIPTP